MESKEIDGIAPIRPRVMALSEKTKTSNIERPTSNIQQVAVSLCAGIFLSALTFGATHAGFHNIEQRFYCQCDMALA